MCKKIIICGGNGSGKSTLGYAFSQQTGIPFFDVEDYYFPDKTKEYKYDLVRSKEQVKKLLYDDIVSSDNFMFAAVKPDYGPEINKLYTHVIYINVPKHVRIERVKKRSYEKFGSKIMPGGELFEKEKAFFQMVQNRSDIEVKEWLNNLNIPVIEIDGTRAISENIEFLIKEFSTKK